VVVVVVVVNPTTQIYYEIYCLPCVMWATYLVETEPSSELPPAASVRVKLGLCLADDNDLLIRFHPQVGCKLGGVLFLGQFVDVVLRGGQVETWTEL